MANATPSRLGVVNKATPADFASENALFLKVFAGEVLTAFDETNVMKDLHTSRTIASGKSASFPVTGKANAAYHTPGTPLLGTQKIAHNEIVINIDDVLVADTFIANIDEAKNHYDVRAEYSRLLGMALAKEFDTRTMRVGLLAARDSAKVSGGFGGTTLTAGTGGAMTGAELAAAIFDAAKVMDEKDVPETERVAIVSPAEYYSLVQTTDVINRDFGGAGVYADGTVLRVAGIQIVKSNNLPTGNVAAVAGENNTYAGDFSNVKALVMQKQAIGTVKLMDLAVERTSGDFEVMYQGTLMAAKYAMGHGVLRPECAVEIKAGA
ncbi:capsid protein [Roseobacter phage CRP-125]|uniref:Capsid protein n=1 Tax=Roseobacter phage CRP-125 TaxID=3072844 RepID=A0AAX3ZVT8_9CAUD|nr:capsid protein [Roseobacter phage CRP-125]